ncbi:MAG TPA: transcriptional regulator MraZ [Candidatus Parcubacteria bacterium]|nr:transcriptional regulator MraZ [Candidatus Parcubacteria bacterium]
MLIGEYKHTIDNKRRLAVPAKFRKELGKRVIITKGLENCLFVYSEKKWEEVMKKLENMPNVQRGARSFARIMLAGAMEVNIDRLGRILIPDYLKKYAGLKKNAVICGLSNKLEVWDVQKWESYKKKVEKDIDSVSEELGELGI